MADPCPDLTRLTEPTRAAGGLVADDEQQDGQGGQLLLAELVGAVPGRDEPGQQGVVRVHAFRGGQAGHVPGDLVRGVVADPVVSGGVVVVGQPAQHVPVGFGGAEQFADHRDRERDRERFDQVRLSRGGYLVEQFVGELLDAGPEAVGGRGGECPGGEASQPGVAGRVRGEHGRGDGGAAGRRRSR
jgi:hypothetical protein